MTLDKNTILYKEKIWEWHYTPKKRSFKDTLDELQILLSKVKNNWPEVKFITTADLIKLCQIKII